MDMINIFLYKYIYFYANMCRLSSRLSNMRLRLEISTAKAGLKKNAFFKVFIVSLRLI